MVCVFVKIVPACVLIFYGFSLGVKLPHNESSLHLFPEGGELIALIIHTHKHKHAFSLTLSLSHTHTHTHTHMCVCGTMLTHAITFTYPLIAYLNILILMHSLEPLDLIFTFFFVFVCSFIAVTVPPSSEYMEPVPLHMQLVNSKDTDTLRPGGGRASMSGFKPTISASKPPPSTPAPPPPSDTSTQIGLAVADTPSLRRTRADLEGMSVKDVANLLQQLNLGQYAQSFIDEQVRNLSVA